MTDTEYIKALSSLSIKELIEEIEWYGCDPYYYDLWKAVINELKRKLENSGVESSDNK